MKSTSASAHSRPRSRGINDWSFLQQLSRLEAQSHELLRVTRLVEVPFENQFLPVHSITLGSRNPQAPCLIYTGGVHGLERIGTEVVLTFLNTLIQRLKWDQSLSSGLEHLTLIFVPALNPVGLLRNTRGNGNGVDLMRNAPIDAESRPPWLAGGHRLHSALPWYRGKKGTPMETESQALIQLIRRECFQRPFSLVLDCHSGFGFKDRLWFPYAYSRKPMEHLGEAYALKQLLNNTYPHLDYQFEPQSNSYTAHGDLWDYLYLESLETPSIFLPMTMEMGSWRWIKKNPRQLTSMSGLFNPVMPHRLQRVLLRHIVLMEFLIRATRAWEQWLPTGIEQQRLYQQAIQHWYGHQKHALHSGKTD
ncbi:DUF2817 domain-containing protein [Aestuariicella hydrocarbonica]|uniref:DUF2817 domain-containing protein n=1 Tax=Pseudomaricurvus hydrocarbonicus TaxID=1470433 RepID=A0A9E5JUN2_9GAMM|nr:DUF2817 domain-containing protein [Aestuariicella hydrocarbonica]NHO64886.1 DUF2817 domain-containing protein [Aestuariicella hydrocarbonica]